MAAKKKTAKKTEPLDHKNMRRSELAKLVKKPGKMTKDQLIAELEA